MSTITFRVQDPRAAVQAAQDVAETPRVSLTSITLTFGGNSGGNGVVVYDNASTSSPDSLRSHNRAVLNAASAQLDAQNAGGSDGADELTDEEFDGTRFIAEEGVFGSLTVAGAAVVPTGGAGSFASLTVSGQTQTATLIVTGAATAASLTISTAASKIIPGATSLSLRNHADSADNLIITDAGVVTVRLRLGVGAAPTAAVPLMIIVSSSVGTAQSNYIELDADASATVKVTGLSIATVLPNSSFTCASAIGLEVNPPLKGASASITNLFVLRLVGTSTVCNKAAGIEMSGGVSGGTAENYGIILGAVTGTGAFAIKTAAGPVDFGDSVNIASGKFYKVNGTQVVSARVTGWTAATNTKSKATFDTTTVTTANLAARVGQMIDDLIAHGLIGA